MTQAIKLTAKEVAIAALKAHAEGRLSAQGPTPGCRYRDESGNPCAIGAAIPDDVANAWDSLSNNTIGSLCTKKLVKATGYEALVEMQDLHDQWANARCADISGEQLSVTRGELARREADFLAACHKYAGTGAPQ